jgi:hypothetical protein
MWFSMIDALCSAADFRSLGSEITSHDVPKVFSFGRLAGLDTPTVLSGPP